MPRLGSGKVPSHDYDIKWLALILIVRVLFFWYKLRSCP